MAAAALTGIAELLAHVIAHPDDRDARLVLGDALMAAGDPRGELILLQARRRDRSELDDEVDAEAREQELIAMHRAAWLGELADVIASVELTWRDGFVHGVELARSSLIEGEDPMFDDLLGRLLRMPANELVREVTVEVRPLVVERWEPYLHALARRGLPPNVQRLALRRAHTSYTARFERTMMPDELYERLATLTSLVIASDAIALARIALPAVRSFELELDGLTRDHVRSIVAADWPHLERLAVGIGVPGERGCNVKPALLRDMLERLRAPKLRHLALRRAAYTDDLAAIVARSRFAGQLETLDLAYGTLTDNGAAELRALAHLQQLDLTHAFLSPAMRDELEQLGPTVILDDPRSPDGDMRRPR